MLKKHFLHLLPAKYQTAMSEALDIIIEDTAKQMKKAIEHLETELS